MFTRKPRLRPAEFLITSAKRLLQHNRHFASFRQAAKFVRSWVNSGQTTVWKSNKYAAFDPKQTSSLSMLMDFANSAVRLASSRPNHVPSRI
jgi:hypothetical protein